MSQTPAPTAIENATAAVAAIANLHDALFPNYRNDTTGQIVQAVQINTPDELLALRDSEWHEGQLRVLTYPSAPPQGWVGPEGDNFTAFNGKPLTYGNYLVKGEAGDCEVRTTAAFEATHTIIERA